VGDRRGNGSRWLLVGWALLAVAIAPATVARAAGQPAGTPVAHSFPGDPTVAAVFPNGLAAGHGCSASVVMSVRRDVLIGAAHCFSGTGSGIQVAPGYRDGLAPYGLWTVTKIYVDPGWISQQNPQRDWAFLVVAPQRLGARLVHVQDLVGANWPLFSLRSGQRVRVPAYPAGTNDRPITCETRAYEQDGYPAFDCDGLVGGTSGSPWLVSTPLGPAVSGVIGGLHQGGCVSWTSYSSALGMPAAIGYWRAVTNAKPDVLPIAGSDRC
jgi:V8-like Glu-specific endopeptidase